DRHGDFDWLAKRTGQSKFVPFRARAHTPNSIPMAENWTIAGTVGRAGAAPNTAAAQKLLQLLDSWAAAPLPADSSKI
ncbi:MAG: hypothetical protein VX085_01995, partial [Pseudomonadota bacterium]|nr:hypothetical protein [Pseudomonadota bacterium]